LTRWRPFWLRRISQGQELTSALNERWGAELAVRMKQDYLDSDRNMDARRFDYSHNMINGKPVPAVLLINPHRPWDWQQRVTVPEPVASR
jgi:hypothetical protein